MTREIELTQGQVALVDDEDYEWLSQWKWFAHVKKGSYYAERSSSTVNGKRHCVFMHRLILGLKFGDGKFGDHINRDTLNNRRSNLRVVSKSVDARNHGGHSNNRSGHNGVIWHTRFKKWHSYIRVNYKHVSLGYFYNLAAAIDARRQGELKYWGAIRN